MERCLFEFLSFKSFFSMSYSQEDFEYLLHRFASHCIQLNFNPIFELNLVEFEFNTNLIQIAKQCCSHLNFTLDELVFFTSRTFQKKFLFHKNLSFPCFSNIISLGAKDNLYICNSKNLHHHTYLLG